MRRSTRLICSVILLALCTQLLDGPLATYWSDAPGLLSRSSAQKIRIRSRSDQQPTARQDDSWQIIFIGDQRIGYTREYERKVSVDEQSLIRTVSDTSMTIKRFGQTLKIQTILTTDETERGKMVSFTYQMNNPPADSTTTVGRIVERNDGTGQKQLMLETTIAGKVKKSGMAWDPAIKSPAYQSRTLRENPLKPGEKRKFKTFDPQFNKVVEIRLSADRLRPTKLFDGKRRNLLKVKVVQSILPTLAIYAYLDEEGSALKTETDFLGQSMLTYEVPKAEALKAIAGKELDVAVNSLVRVKPIRNVHGSRKGVYRIIGSGEDPSEYLIADHTQSVKKIDAETVELTVNSLEIPDGNKNIKAEQIYLKPTRFLQTRDERVRAHARRAAAGEVNPARIAIRMEQYVHERLRNKNFSTALASAAEVAEKMEGDCTEHAVLLAAMLRAEKIPSRIAVGMVYAASEAAFGGHMWTEAWLDGKWIPLDATLGKGGIGVGHIKMAVSSFDDDGPAPVTTFLPLMKIMGKMKIEVQKVE